MLEDQPWIPKDDVVLVDERGDLIVVWKASSCRAALDAQWLDREGATRSPPVGWIPRKSLHLVWAVSSWVVRRMS